MKGVGMAGAAVLAALAIGFLIAAVFNKRRSTWLSEATPAAISAISSQVGQLVRTAGTVQAGPIGPVQGPMSGQPGAWWATRVDAEWFEERQSSQGGSQRRRRTRILSQDQSRQPFAIVEGHRGEVHGGADHSGAGARVLVAAHDVEVDNANQTVHQRDHGSLLGRLNLTVGGVNLGGGTTYIQREWVLPEGARVEAVGTVEQDADGGYLLVDGDRGKLVVTTRDIDALVKRSRMYTVLFGGLAAVAAIAAVIVAVVV